MTDNRVFYCERCNSEVKKEDTLTPLMRGFGSILVHRSCLQIVKEMTMACEMDKKEEGRNLVFTAIDTYDTPLQIQQFYKHYVVFMKSKGLEERVANSNVGYVLGYYPDKTLALWYKALPSVSHPVFGPGFGREKKVTTEKYSKHAYMGEETPKKKRDSYGTK